MLKPALSFGLWKILFEPSRKLSSAMKLAEHCLKVGLSDRLGLFFSAFGKVVDENLSFIQSPVSSRW
jgi:hypothetical protein